MKYYLFWGMLSIHTAGAQTVLPSEPLVVLGVSGYLPSFQDAFAPLHNAAMQSHTASGCGMYAEQRFLIREWNSFVLAGSFRQQQRAGTGVLVYYMGTASSQYVQAGLTHGRSLGVVDLGVRLQYTSIGVAGYGRDGTLHSAIALGWPVHEKLYTGFQASNFLGGRFRKLPQERLARCIDWGMGYALSSQVALVFIARKWETRPLALTGALYYRLPGQWQLCAGYDAGKQVPWLDTSWQKKRLQVGVRISCHPRLGLTPGLQLQLREGSE